VKTGNEFKANILFSMVFAALIVAASFYLFALPVLVTNHSIRPTGEAVAFGAFLYIQLWVLTLEYAYASAASLYRFRRQHLLSFLFQPTSGRAGFRTELARILTRRREVSGLETVFFCALSYLFMLYGFAVAYTFVSQADPKAFTVAGLDIFAAGYFSVVTAATVGYGDIAPVSVAARTLVMAQIGISLLYAVFFFSILASAVRDGASRGPNA